MTPSHPLGPKLNERACITSNRVNGWLVHIHLQVTRQLRLPERRRRGSGGSTRLYSRCLREPSGAASKPVHCFCTLLCICSATEKIQRVADSHPNMCGVSCGVGASHLPQGDLQEVLGTVGERVRPRLWCLQQHLLGRRDTVDPFFSAVSGTQLSAAIRLTARDQDRPHSSTTRPGARERRGGLCRSPIGNAWPT